jgi:HD-GYP domain-containing protein (c-di-GMP phosphodiesterase class II)
MFQRIKGNELKPGMFVVSHGLGTFSSPLVRVGELVVDQAGIDAIMQNGIDHVLIDPSKSAPALAAAQPGPAQAPTNLLKELPATRLLYSDALDYVKQFMEDVRRGTDINCGRATNLVERFVQNVLRNDTAAVTLFKLRGFDQYTYTHSINVSILAVLLGKHLGLDRHSLLDLGLAGLLHDAGKEFVPAHILNKPGKLTEKEFQAVKGHPLDGYNLLRKQRDMPVDVLRAVLEHHERHDGTGYPRGIRGDGIGMYSRILVLVDVYDALTSDRVYKKALPPANALNLMYQLRGQQFAVDDIENFIRCIGVFPMGSFVRLSGGEFGIVASTNNARPTKPEIKVVMDAKMRPQRPRVLDLEAMENTPQAQEIAEVLNPADYKIDVERFLCA